MTRTEGPIGETPYVTRLALDPADVEAAARLRFEVYIAELGKHDPQADLPNRRLSDALDGQSDILLVEDTAGSVVGTVRSHGFAPAQAWTRHDSLYALREFAHLPRSMLGLCSHLAVHKAHRRFQARDLLFRALYALQIERGIRLCFAACAPLVSRVFEHYGFREYAAPLHDPRNGAQRRLVLALDDLEYLARIRSPFLELAQSRGIAQSSRPWLEELIAHQAAEARR